MFAKSSIEPFGDDSGSESGSCSDSGSESGDEDEWTERKPGSDKYRRRLPDQSDGTERESVKAERKLAKAAAKEAAAEKRKVKIKKHVKKRAVKGGKAKK